MRDTRESEHEGTSALRLAERVRAWYPIGRHSACDSGTDNASANVVLYYRANGSKSPARA